MPSLAQLIQQKTDQVDFHGVIVNFAYSQQRMSIEETQRFQAIITQAKETGNLDQAGLAGIMSSLLVSWDLTENDNATPVALTVDRLTRTQPHEDIVPGELLTDIIQKVSDNFPTPAGSDTPAPQPASDTLPSETN